MRGELFACCVTCCYGVLAVLAMPGLARGQAQAPGTAASQTGASQGAADVLVVRFDESTAELPRAQITDAIARELGVQVVAEAGPGQAVLHLSLEPTGVLRLTFVPASGPLTRELPWRGQGRGDDATASRDVALMAVNLVRDQTADLLGEAPSPSPSRASSQGAPGLPPLPSARRVYWYPDYGPAERSQARRRPPLERARLFVLAAVLPDSYLASNADGGPAAWSGTRGLGAHARAEWPLSRHLLVGGGAAITAWDNAERGAGASSVMDAELCARLRLPLASGLEAHLGAGIGPTLPNEVWGSRDADDVGPPRVGVFSELWLGGSVSLLDDLGVVLEAGVQYRYLHASRTDAERLEIFAVQPSLRLGAVWGF